MDTANWFNDEFYMNAKLAQMIANDPKGEWTLPKLVQTFAAAGFVGPEGAQAHFEAFGANEGLSPNPFFIPSEYYRAKAAEKYGKSPSAVTDLDAANIELAIKQAGMNAWSHYTNFGSAEGVNPSNSFDTNAYMAAKLAAMQAANPEGSWTEAALLSAFQAAGLSALEHFMVFGGAGAGEVAQKYDPTKPAIPFEFSVSEENKVTPDPTNGGATHTLKAGVDTLVGTMYGDVFNATDATLEAGDSIDGGAGKDVLNLNIADSTNYAVVGNISNVEVFNVSGASSSAVLASTDLSAFAGLRALNATKALGNITATNMGEGGEYGVNGQGAALGSAAYAFGYADAATTATLNIFGGGATGAATVALTGIGLTSTVINTSGEASELASITEAASSTTTTINANADLTTTLAGTGTTKLVVTGTGTVDLAGAALKNAVVDVDASAMTAGGLLVAAGTSDAFKFTGGAGDDAVITGAVLATGRVDAGKGTDTLMVTDSTHITATTGKYYTGFEVAGVDATDRAVTLNMDNLATGNAIGAVIINQGSTSYTAGVTNMTAEQAANVLVTDAKGTTAITFGIKGATTSGQIDTLNVTFDDGEEGVHANAFVLTTPVMEGIEKLELVANDSVTISALTGAASLTSLIASGAGNVSITTGDVAFAANSTFDLTKVTGAVTFDASAYTGTNGLSIKGSATAANTLKGGAGNDSILGGAKNDEITGGKGDDTIDISQGGSDTIVFDTATNNGKDTLKGFQAGDITKGGDVLSVATGSGVTLAGITAAITDLKGAVVAANNGLYTVNYNAAISGLDFGGADFAKLFAATDTAFSTTAGEAAKFIIVVQGTDASQIYFVDAGTGDTTVASNEVTLVGVLEGVTNGSTFLGDNFG